MLEDRVLFVVDCQNLYYGSKEEFVKDKRVSFGRLRYWLYKRCKPSSMHSLACVALSSGTIKRLVEYLERAGYEVTQKISRNCGDNTISNTDIDAKASVEIISRIDNFDRLIMASGDSDFIPVYQYCKNKGKRVEVVCFRSSFNRDLLQVVDSVTFLGSEVTYPHEEERGSTGGTS